MGVYRAYRDELRCSTGYGEAFVKAGSAIDRILPPGVEPFASEGIGGFPDGGRGWKVRTRMGSE